MFSQMKSWLVTVVLLFSFAGVGNAAGQPTYFYEPIGDVFDNRPSATWSVIEAAAKEQAASQPIIKSNTVEGRGFEGYFKANAATSKLALLSDDGADVYIDGTKIHSAKGVGQHLPDLTKSLIKINYNFEPGKLYKVLVDYSNEQLAGNTDIDGVTLFSYDGGGSIIEPDIPELGISSPYIDYVTDSVQEIWVGIRGPESLKGQQFNITVSGNGQSQVVPLKVSDDPNERIAIIYFDMPSVLGSVTFKAEVKVLQETVWDRVSLYCMEMDPEAIGEGDWQFVADNSVNASVREALRKAATDPDEALAILDTLKNSASYSGRAKILIDTAIGVATAYKTQAQSGGAIPWARINPDTVIDVVKKLGSDAASKFVQALSRQGYARAEGESGVKLLKPAIKAAGKEWSYELKIMGSKYRLLGNAVDEGEKLVIEFQRIGGHR